MGLAFLRSIAMGLAFLLYCIAMGLAFLLYCIAMCLAFLLYCIAMCLAFLLCCIAMCLAFLRCIAMCLAFLRCIAMCLGFLLHCIEQRYIAIFIFSTSIFVIMELGECCMQSSPSALRRLTSFFIILYTFWDISPSTICPLETLFQF